VIFSGLTRMIDVVGEYRLEERVTLSVKISVKPSTTTTVLLSLLVRISLLWRDCTSSQSFLFVEPFLTIVLFSRLQQLVA